MPILADIQADVVAKGGALTQDQWLGHVVDIGTGGDGLEYIALNARAFPVVLNAVLRENLCTDVAIQSALPSLDADGIRLVCQHQHASDASLGAAVMRTARLGDLGFVLANAHGNVGPTALTAVATRADNAAHLSRVANHPHADAAALDAVMGSGALNDAARTAVATNNHASTEALTTLTGLNNVALDALIVQRPNTAAADLAAIAGRRAADAVIIAAIRAHARAGDALVVAALLVIDNANLALAGNDAATEAQLQALTVLNNPALDALIVQRPNTAAADLAAIAGRRAADAVIIAAVAAHANANANALHEVVAAGAGNDAAVAGHVNADAADLSTILGRTVAPIVLRALAVHANTNAFMALAIANHANADAAVLTALQGTAHNADPAVAAALLARAPVVRMHVLSDAAKSLAAGKGVPAGTVLTTSEKDTVTKQAAKKRGV